MECSVTLPPSPMNASAYLICRTDEELLEGVCVHKYIVLQKSPI